MTHTEIDTTKSNDNRNFLPSVASPTVTACFSDRILLPVLPAELPQELVARWEIDVYARFMRHLRCVPNSRMEIKILHAIQYVADVMDAPEEHIAKVLVDYGLRAPRLAFPASFLEYADGAILRGVMDIGGPSTSLLALKGHWDALGEDKLAAFKRPPVLRTPPMYARSIFEEKV